MNTPSAILQRANEFASSHSLGEIEQYAEHIRRDANYLAHYSKTLASLPDYETKAEDAVATAMAALDEALIKTKVAYLVIMAKRGEKK